MRLPAIVPILGIWLLLLSGCNLFDSSENREAVFPTAVSFPTLLQPDQELIIEIGYYPVARDAGYALRIEGSSRNYDIFLTRNIQTKTETEEAAGLVVVPLGVGSAEAGSYSLTFHGDDGNVVVLNFEVGIDTLGADFLVQSNGHGQDLSQTGNPDSLVLGLYNSRDISDLPALDTLSMPRDGNRYHRGFSDNASEWYFAIEPNVDFLGNGQTPNAFRITRLAPRREVHFLQYLY